MAWTKLIESEEQELVDSMRARRGLNNPEVGSFFYDMQNKKLMLVDTIPMKNAETNGGGKKTTDKLHENVWFENDMTGDFKDTPRGRVFYNVKTETYEIMVGDWADEVSNIEELVKRRFHLENENTIVMKGSHWNLGEGFEGVGFDY